MQPYQQADEAIKKQGEFPLKAAKTAGKLASSIGVGAIGGALASRIIPFLSQYIPESIAVGALTRIDKRFGKFFKKAATGGATFEEARDFIREKVEPADKAEAVKKYNAHKKKKSVVDEELMRFQQNYQQQQSPQVTPQPQEPQVQPQAAGADQAIIAALQKILQM